MVYVNHSTDIAGHPPANALQTHPAPDAGTGVTARITRRVKMRAGSRLEYASHPGYVSNQIRKRLLPQRWIICRNDYFYKAMMIG
jgi:hypothetical protein